jgi:hypothetical protein
MTNSYSLLPLVEQIGGFLLGMATVTIPLLCVILL